MDPPIAAPAAALHEPQAEAESATAFSIDHLLLFDDVEGDGEAAFTPSVASNGLSIPAHEALMAFLTEMEAFDRDGENDEQQSNGGSSYAETIESIPETIASTGDKVGVVVERETVEVKPKQTAGKRRSHRKSARVTESSGPKPGKKRIRAKQEIDMLREDAAALQHQLEKIKARATKKQKQEAANEAALAKTSAASQAKKPKLRHAGDVEQNRQLRKLVKTQLRFVKQIENVLMSKSDDDEAHSILISDTAVTQTPLSKADLGVFYDALTGKLDTIYAQLDDVFADTDRQYAHKHEFNDVKLVVDANKHATLQLRDMKTLPFSFGAMKDVSWRFLKSQSVQEGDGADEFFVADKDVTLMRRGLTVQLEEGRQVEIPTRSVSKRFLSKDRLVFCWDGTTDWPIPPKSGKPSPQSVPLREKGWAVIKPVPGAPGFSTIQMCILTVPGIIDERMYANVTRQEIKEGMTKSVIPTYQQLFVSRYQMIENMLLDEKKR